MLKFTLIKVNILIQRLKLLILKIIKEKFSIVYLTWGETPRSYGVFGSQVIRQFAETAKFSEYDKFFFISGIPIVHSGFIREGWRYFNEFKLIREKLNSIVFGWLPILAPQNFINSSKASFIFMHGISHYFLFRKFNKIKPDLVHCRSYHATWAALRVKEKFGFTYKVIFDARGLWPEEVALKKKWTSDSKNYRFLKLIEKKIISCCDTSVSVSTTMHKHFLSMGVKRDKCIYLSADPLLCEETQVVHNKTEIVKFCYLGALCSSTWHQPDDLKRLYKRLRNLFPQTILTIITTSNHLKLRKVFCEYDDNEIRIISSRSLYELKKILSEQDFGLMSYFIPKNKKEIQLSSTVFAVKTSEYLMAGLPLICNSACGGASIIIKENDLGIVYDPENLYSFNENTLIKYLNKTAKKKCKEFALHNLTYKVNSYKYYKLYISLIKEKLLN